MVFANNPSNTKRHIISAGQPAERKRPSSPSYSAPMQILWLGLLLACEHLPPSDTCTEATPVQLCMQRRGSVVAPQSCLLLSH